MMQSGSNSPDREIFANTKFWKLYFLSLMIINSFNNVQHDPLKRLVVLLKNFPSECISIGK